MFISILIIIIEYTRGFRRDVALQRLDYGQKYL